MEERCCTCVQDGWPGNHVSYNERIREVEHVSFSSNVFLTAGGMSVTATAS